MMKLWTHPIVLTAAVLWATTFLWMIVHLLRAPLAVEGQHGLTLLNERR